MSYKLTRKERESYAHWSRFGPYRYEHKMTRDMREVFYLVIKGKRFPVAQMVFSALSRDGLIIRDNS